MDHYSLLKIERTANQAMVEEAYCRFKENLASYGPGIVFEESEMQRRMPEVWEAYGVLRDPEKRKIYDDALTVAQPAEAIENADIAGAGISLARRLASNSATILFVLLFLSAIVFLATLLTLL